MEIRLAKPEDKDYLAMLDRHIQPKELANSIRLGRVAIAWQQGKRIGWYRYNLFWDNTPFLNLLFLLGGHRGRGYGRQMVRHWEQQMQAQGFQAVMTSTVCEEGTQRFYEKLGYRQIGGFWPADGRFEVLLAKEFAEG